MNNILAGDPTSRRWLRTHWLELFFSALCTALVVAGNLVEPLFVRFAVDRIILGGQTALWFALAASWVGLFVGQHCLLYLQLLLVRRICEEMSSWLRERLFKRHLHRPPSATISRDVGDIVLELTQDVADVEQLWAPLPIALLFYVVSALGALAIAVMISLRLSLYLATMVLALSITWRWVSSNALLRTALARNSMEAIAIAIRKYLVNHRLIHFYDYVDVCESESKKAIRIARTLHMKLVAWEWLGRVLGNSMEFGAIGGVLLLGGSLVVNGNLSLGSLFSYILYLTYLAQSFREIGNRTIPLNKAYVALNRINFEFQDNGEMSSGNSSPRHVDRIRSLGLHNATYAWPKSLPVLSQCSVKFEPGNIHVIVGPNGSGKSTIIDLLAGFVSTSSGHLFVNELRLEKPQIQSYRSKLGLVLQDSLVIEASVEENLRMANQSVTKESIRSVLQAVELPPRNETAHGFLSKDAVALSAGQKCRVSLARALLRKPDVLLLDEPFANLDLSSTEALCAQLRKLCSECIIILTAQRTDFSLGCIKEYCIHQGVLVQPPKKSI